MSADTDGLDILLISVHGLIRGHETELGRDADTGGQVRYVLELAQALSEQDGVDRVELLTRQILDIRVDPEYSEPREQIAERAWIVRLPCGPSRYVRKESLWPYLDDLVDQTLQYLRHRGRLPDVIHSHYADAGYVGRQLAAFLNRPLVHTGHSLGRVKRQRLLDKGLDEATIESRYHIGRRIDEEERTLAAADLVVASTRQEVEEQYGRYERHRRSRMVVISPGVDLSSFRPPRRGDPKPAIALELARFLRDPRKPMVLAVQRPDERKNLKTLIGAFAGHSRLRERANLVLLIGSRDDVDDADRGQRKVLEGMLKAIDRHDLYGSVAYPKRHASEDVPELYRLAARLHGVFVNPALTEPFGLTLIEAAASGLPVIAPDDGGPKEILENCGHGEIVNTLDADAMAAALDRILSDPRRWRTLSRAGQRAARDHYSWRGHAERYLKSVHLMQARRARTAATSAPAVKLASVDRLMVVDIDHTLLGDRQALEQLLERLRARREVVAFGIATGRVLPSAMRVLKEWGVPTPDVLITAVGTEIHYTTGGLIPDLGWQHRIDHRWRPDRVRELLADLPGLKPQPKSQQRRFKVSYFIDPDAAPSVAKMRARLREAGVAATVISSHDAYLDVLPVRASKGRAVLYLASRWGLDTERILVAGDSGNDADMLRSGARAVVVGNHEPELDSLGRADDVYMADGHHAWGVLEGIEHWQFFETERRPIEAEEEDR